MIFVDIINFSELPATPSLTIVGNEVCFDADSPSKFPIQYYELAIFDVTGEREYYKTSI